MSAKKISLVEILIWFIVFLLLLLVVSPFAMGFKIKSDYAVMVTDLSDMMQADVRIVSYSRGFFSSDAMLELKIPETPVDVKFKETIIHGPVYLGLLNQGKSPLVAAVINGELVIDPARQAEVQKVFKGQSPLVYQSIVSYTGDVTSDGYVPPFDIEIEQETGPVNIQSSGLVLKSQYMVAAQAISGESTLGGLKWSDGQASFNSENLSMNFSARMGQNGLLMGDSNLALGKLDIQSAQDQFAIHDLRFRTISSEVGPLVNSSMQVNAREIYASNERFGPATFNLSINGLNASSLKQLQTMQQEIEAKAEQGVPPEQINAMVAGQMIALVPNLMQQAEIKINPFKLESELGAMQTTLSISVEGLDQNTPADPMFMLSALNLDADLAVDEPLMRQMIEWYISSNADKVEVAGDNRTRKAERQIPMEQKVSENLQGLIDENWLTLNEGVYNSRVSLHQGQMQLNNRQVDPMQLFMSQMQPPAGP